MNICGPTIQGMLRMSALTGHSSLTHPGSDHQATCQPATPARSRIRASGTTNANPPHDSNGFVCF